MATIGELMLLWDIRDELKRANDLVEEERLRRSEEELRKSGLKVKQKLSEEIRTTGNSMLTRAKMVDPQKPKIYPDISAEQEADMLLSGELLLDILHDKDRDNDVVALYVYWADETREEAKHPWYIERKELWAREIAKENKWVNGGC